ncbi:electron transfer protein with DM13 domain [Rivularia sp. PCC 7116]|uniref:DM13 domain-containing protein n=1 Tax=Rivularia sp. PCC 7116 TaxID=373994 RepID=UPI00029EC827|nr:DM13 domain-containing protein [Rivularia sp. PCC 7116]AFY57178.1 electron transfer protein with DM13 domain [Rivularia sp. PCC 7116]
MFNKLAGFGIASIVLLGSVSELAINTSTASAAKPAANNTTLLAAKPQLIASGSFVTTEQDHPTNGIAKIVEVNGKRYLQFDKAFTTARGPKVRVVLHRNNTVPVNLKEENYVTLASLKKFDGAQNYEIPDNFDLKDFQSVAIWCEEFNVTFGYASLQDS